MRRRPGMGSLSQRYPGKAAGDLAEAGYIVKQKNGRRNRYQTQAHLPLPEPASRERTVGEVLALLAGAGARLRPVPSGRT